MNIKRNKCSSIDVYNQIHYKNWLHNNPYKKLGYILELFQITNKLNISDNIILSISYDNSLSYSDSIREFHKQINDSRLSLENTNNNKEFMCISINMQECNNLRNIGSTYSCKALISSYNNRFPDHNKIVALFDSLRIFCKKFALNVKLLDKNYHNNINYLEFRYNS